MHPIAITGLGSYLPRRLVRTEELELDKPITAEQLARIGVERRGR